ncbi:MAG: AI-2E family transporter [Sphingomonadaceae bacterium]|nr:AI-2E family transporter [Sphingomonadaceae bacterium]
MNAELDGDALQPDEELIVASGVSGRDRLLAALVLMTGVLLFLVMPFALRAGEEFFLPVTAGLVVAVALVPLLEWLERRRVPSAIAAFICIVLFIAVANLVIAAIVVPAADWVSLLPERIGQIKTTIKPLIDIYASLNKFINETSSQIALTRARAVRTVALEAPSSLLGLLTTAAPFALIQIFFAVLLVFFFLAGWSSMRRRTITGRASFTSALTLARVIQEVVDATSSYIATITLINVSLGGLVAGGLYLAGLPTPLMWGGIVALLNYIPYLGPLIAAALLALGGLMMFSHVWQALTPAGVFVCCHLVESNIITPTILGRRLTINPLMILVALSFWGWVWGALGAVLAVPLLIITRTVISAAGTPDIAGFLFEHGTLTARGPDPSREEPPPLDSPEALS